MIRFIFLIIALAVFSGQALASDVALEAPRQLHGLFAAEAADLIARQIEDVVALHELLVTGTLRIPAKGGAESRS